MSFFAAKTVGAWQRSTAWGVVARIVGVLAVVAGVTFLAFLLAYVSPTDPATRFFTDKGMVPTEAELAAKRTEMNLDAPFVEQYAMWVGDLLHADMGQSYRNGADVAASLIRALPYTLALTGTSMLLTLLIAVPLGLACAYYRGGALDGVVRFVTYAFNALPTFFVALMLLYVLSVRLHLFAVTATRDAAGLVMPSLSMALPLSAWYVRQVRSIALEQLSADYVSGLRARGISERAILFKHVLRNIAVPLLTLVGVSIGSLLGGAAIVESIFSWPGVGNLSVVAIGARDYPVIQGYALVMAVAYLLINALVELTYRLVDPRQRSRGC